VKWKPTPPKEQAGSLEQLFGLTVELLFVVELVVVRALENGVRVHVVVKTWFARRCTARQMLKL